MWRSSIFRLAPNESCIIEKVSIKTGLEWTRAVPNFNFILIRRTGRVGIRIHSSNEEKIKCRTKLLPFPFSLLLKFHYYGEKAITCIKKRHSLRWVSTEERWWILVYDGFNCFFQHSLQPTWREVSYPKEDSFINIFYRIDIIFICTP